MRVFLILMLVNVMRADSKTPAVERALALLEIPAEENRGFTLASSAKRRGLLKSGAPYLVPCLGKRGYLRRSAGRQYALRLRAQNGPAKAIAEPQFVGLAMRYVAEMAARIGLPACLASPRYAMGPAVFRHAQPGPVSGLRPPRQAKPYCVAAGKAAVSELLACSGPGDRRPHIVYVRMAISGSSLGESAVAVCCIAAPIRNNLGAVVAGMFVSASARLEVAGLVQRIARQVARTAEEISRDLCAAPAAPAGYHQVEDAWIA
ncbi:MAG: hypothetical protein IT160_16290 [Bryobacterales bacterium]|nr:hypothetical protein [Bryobacterales bacterium]